jgi:thiosulfate/3-mercaptopyruvate sulfurtransferase
MPRTVLAAVLALGLPPFATAHEAGARVDPIVSTAWVAEHLHDPDLLLVHVAMAHMGMPDRLIPGAVFLDYHAIETSQNLPVELPPVDELVKTLRGVGLSNSSRVVLYGPKPAHLAARVFMTLEYLGQARVSVMDGGIEAWIAEGRPVVDHAAAPKPGAFEARVDPDVVVDAQWVKAHLADPKVALVDARPRAEFENAGHIPGAHSLYFGELLRSDELRLKTEADARALFEKAGAGAGRLVVSYCQVGMRASYDYLVARQLGYAVRLYDGSWAEWGARADLPKEKGSR